MTPIYVTMSNGLSLGCRIRHCIGSIFPVAAFSSQFNSNFLKIENRSCTEYFTAWAMLVNVRGKKGRGTMFLIRTAFWLSLVIMFLPAGSDSVEGDANTVGALEAYVAAQEAYGDLSMFCERNADACKTGNAAIATFGQKARNGAQIVFEYLDIKFGEDEPVPIAKSLSTDDS